MTLKQIVDNVRNFLGVNILRRYDYHTANIVNVSVGDIMLQRGNKIDEKQFLIASRWLDAKNFDAIGGGYNFLYMNAISNSSGLSHDAERANRAFIKLIDSYKKKGYMATSLLDMDNNAIVNNGTHRVALNIFTGASQMRVRMFQRKLPISSNLDPYFNRCLPLNIIKDIRQAYDEIQNYLTNNGHTFCAVISADSYPSLGLIIQQYGRILSSKEIESVHGSQKTLLIQFSLNNPGYYASDNKIVSRCVEKMQRYCKRYDIDAKFSKNCSEGHILYTSCCNQLDYCTLN